MALTGRRPAEIFFSASFSLPPKKLPFPAIIFEGQLKTRHAPGTSFEPYPIPVLAEPKRIHRSPTAPSIILEAISSEHLKWRRPSGPAS
jgi:hypothetical protein